MLEVLGYDHRILGALTNGEQGRPQQQTSRFQAAGTEWACPGERQEEAKEPRTTSGQETYAADFDARQT